MSNIFNGINWNRLKTGFKWSSENEKAFADGFKNSQIELGEISQRLEAGLGNSTGEKKSKIFTLKVARLTLEAKTTRSDKNWKKGKNQKSGSIRIVLSLNKR